MHTATADTGGIECLIERGELDAREGALVIGKSRLIGYRSDTLARKVSPIDAPTKSPDYDKSDYKLFDWSGSIMV